MEWGVRGFLIQPLAQNKSLEQGGCPENTMPFRECKRAMNRTRIRGSNQDKFTYLQTMKLSHIIPAHIIPIGFIALVSIVGAVYLGKSALDSSGLVQIQAPNGISVTVDGRPPSAR
jgi:hypothetical protein